ncbi:MAG: hypothetical protein NT061_03965 [Spirochaetes bacterium]|nr:hypothetical protein [Spirochaetota bacterium]
MSIEIVVLAVSGALILFVLVRISLTLNEISASLRRLARRKAESGKTAASAILHEEEAAKEPESGSEEEIAVAIAAARAELEMPRTSEEMKR